MINRMSIERLATNIMKRAAVADHITDTEKAIENERHAIADLAELADRFGFDLIKRKELAA